MAGTTGERRKWQAARMEGPRCYIRIGGEVRLYVVEEETYQGCILHSATRETVIAFLLRYNASEGHIIKLYSQIGIDYFR